MMSEIYHKIDMYLLNDTGDIFIISELSRYGSSVICLRGGTTYNFTDLEVPKYTRYWAQIGDTLQSDVSGLTVTVKSIGWSWAKNEYFFNCLDTKEERREIMESVARQCFNSI